MRIALQVNDGSYELDVAPHRRLVDVLRDDLGLLGTKLGMWRGSVRSVRGAAGGRAAASCILLAAAAEGREIRTIEGLSRDGPTRSRRRSSPRTPFSAASARPARSSRRRRCSSARRVRPRRRSGTPWPATPPLRRVPEDRARDPPRGGGGVMARLVRSTREMEGRVEEVWALVDEEDDLETWPAGAELAVVGGEAPRLDGPVRAAGRAEYTVDVRLPGMLHAAVLRAPVAHARVTGLDVGAALVAPGVRAVLTPTSKVSFDDASPLAEEADYAGQPLAVVAADTPEHAAAGSPPRGRDRGAAARRRSRHRAAGAAVHARPVRIGPR